MSNEYTKFDTAEVALQCDLPDGVDLPSDRQRCCSFAGNPLTASRPHKSKTPCRSKGSNSGSLRQLAGSATQDVRSQKAFGALQEFKLHSFAFIQRAIAVFLDRGKMNENVFPGRTLDEAVSFGS